MGLYLFKKLPYALLVGAGTFVTALLIVLGADVFLDKLVSILLSFVFLIIIIFIGILFDIIGVAVAVANEAAFHSMAAKKIVGAKQSVTLVRNAERVASFCCDVVGDISGTVSGAIGATIIFRLVTMGPEYNSVILGAIMTASVAALTVSGKAIGKTLAINEANKIIYMVGKLLYWIEQKTGIVIVKKTHRKQRR